MRLVRRARARLGRGWIDAAGAAAVSVAFVALLLLFSDLKTTGTADYRDPGWDRHYYVEMARHGAFSFHIAPFCWRVVVPALADASPLGLQASFLGIAVVSTVVAGSLYFLALRAARLELPYALTGVGAWFAIGWGTRFYLVDFWLPDAFAYMCVAICFWSAVTRRPVVFAAALLLGAAAKESVLFAGPLYYTLNAARLLDFRLLNRSAFVVAPAVAAVLLLRVGIEERNADAAYVQSLPYEIRSASETLPNYRYSVLFREIVVKQRWKERTMETLSSFSTDAFTPALFFLAVIGAGMRPGLAVRLSPFLLLVYAQLMFATDTERLLALGGFAVAWLAVEALRALARRFALWPWGFILLPGILLAYLLAEGQRYEVTPLVASLALLAAFAAAFARRVARSGPIDSP
jgi:hypothetical protein